MYKDDRVLEMDGRNGIKNANVLNAAELFRTLTDGYDGKFYVMCILPQLKIILKKKKKKEH